MDPIVPNLSTASVVPYLPVSRYRFTFDSLFDGKWPRYSGSMWRGAFGRALKHALCVMEEPTACEECTHLRSCLYPYLFKTPVPENAKKLRRYPNAPPPYIIEPVQGFTTAQRGQILSVDLVLVGRANQYLSLVIQAMRHAGLLGLGWGFKKLNLVQVSQQQPDSPKWQPVFELKDGSLATATPEAPQTPTPEPRNDNTVALRFHSALKLRCRGKYLGSDDVEFRDILSTLLRRISMLSYFHTSQPFETDFAGLVQAAQNVRIVKRTLAPRPWARYSTAQQKPIRMDGSIGEIVAEGDELDRFWPLLWLGQWTHVGKGASMGLGGYTLIDNGKLAVTDNG